MERMRTPRWAGHFPPLPTAPTPPCTPVAGNKARGRPTTRLRDPWAAPHTAPARPTEPFSVGPELSGRRPLPPADEPLGPASGPGSPYGGRGKPAQPSTGAARPAAPQQAEGRGSPPPPAAHSAGPSPTRRSPARRHRLQQLRTPAPQPRGPGASPNPASPGVPGLPGSAAHGAGSGGGNVNKSGFYSYLTLECRVHLLSARYQTPGAPSRVFSKAACAICVAEPSARAGALRRQRTQPALAPCAAAPWPSQRYAGGAPGPLGRPAQPHLGQIGATPAAHRQRPAIHFADAPGVGEPRHRRELHRLAATGRN